MLAKCWFQNVFPWPLICDPLNVFLSSSLPNKVTSWIKYPVWSGPHLRPTAQEANFDVIAVLLLHLFGPFHLAPSHLSFSPSPPRCQSIHLPLYHALSGRGGRPQPLFVTADVRQFSCVNDKRCANYLSGCFSANQTLTSCERVGVHVWAPSARGATWTSAQLHFNDRKSCRDGGVEITYLRP